MSGLVERDRCASCKLTLPERSPSSPAVRYCQDDWWAEQRRLFAAGLVDQVHRYALASLQRAARP